MGWAWDTFLKRLVDYLCPEEGDFTCLVADFFGPSAVSFLYIKHQQMYTLLYILRFWLFLG